MSTQEALAVTVPDPSPLDFQRRAFASRRFLAMPLAGAIAWTFVTVCAALLPTGLATWAAQP